MSVFGADTDELDRLAAEFRRAADDLDRDGGLMTQLLNNVSWLGDVASRFVGGWTGVQLPKIGLSTRFLREAADQLAENARQQRAASTAAGGSTTAPTPLLSGVGPAVVPIDEYVRGKESKSGAVVRGVDGSEIALREMSDGTFEVVITLANGMTLDAGDAAALWGIAHGKFFTEGGIEWDFDASLLTEGSTTFSFTDERSARLFFDAVGTEFDSATSTISGLRWGAVQAALSRVDDELTGNATWVGYRGATEFSATGSFGFRAGDEGLSSATSLEISGLKGFSTGTVFSDGGRGEMSTMAGSVAGHGEVKVGDFTLDGSGLTGYERELHLIRDAHGNPARLEVTERFLAGAEVSGGTELLGTGATSSNATTTRVDSVKVFDLTDPGVSGSFRGSDSVDDMFAWSQEYSVLAGQTVSTYSGESSHSSASLLFSGEWSNASESSVLTSSSYRSPGSSEYSAHLGDMRPQNEMTSQIVTDQDGRRTVVWTASY